MKNFGKKIIRIFLALIGCLILGLAFLFIFFAKDLPRPEKFTEKQTSESTKIYDSTGEVLLYEIYGEEKRTIVPLSSIPDYLQKAVIAAEDANFYNHFGIDVKSTLNSIVKDIKTASLNYGGSTIPQQLIRSTFLSTDKNATRKIREIILSIELDRRYDKNQILEWYLNQVPFGQNAYGAEAASQTYFNKSVSELSLAQAAVLTAMIKGPSYYSPYGSHKAELLVRKDYVLDRMVSEGYITEDESESAKKEQITFEEISDPIKAPHFTLWVKEYLEEKYGEDFLREKGLKVYTSLDWELQQQAEEIVKEESLKNRSSNADNAALVAIDPKTGKVLAMVGSADYFGDPYPEGCVSGLTCTFDPKFNAAVGSSENPGRQPGSSFKPFVYATAFEKGYTDTTTVIDAETNFGNWGGKDYIPQNYDGKFRGEVTLRQALAQSLNIPAIKVLLNMAGLEDSVKTAQSMGISTLNPPYGPAIVLGGWEVKLLDMTSAYGVFATEGMQISPVSILKITDSDGNIIEQNKKSLKRVLSVNACRLISDILSDNDARAPIFGYGSSLYFSDYQVAAKTGTTQDYRDAWTIGYTPSIAVGVWVGNSDNSPINQKTGAMIAAPIWHKFLAGFLSSHPEENFTEPASENSTSTSENSSSSNSF
jgi:1A family penicillin-binding protein